MGRVNALNLNSQDLRISALGAGKMAPWVSCAKVKSRIQISGTPLKSSLW